MQGRGKSVAYIPVVTEHVDELLNNILHYLLYQLKYMQAVKHSLDEI